jgi:hypothetical protein
MCAMVIEAVPAASNKLHATCMHGAQLPLISYWTLSCISSQLAQSLKAGCGRSGELRAEGRQEQARAVTQPVEVCRGGVLVVQIRHFGAACVSQALTQLACIRVLSTAAVSPSLLQICICSDPEAALMLQTAVAVGHQWSGV